MATAHTACVNRLNGVFAAGIAGRGDELQVADATVTVDDILG